MTTHPSPVHTLLALTGVPESPRYSMKEVAQILGIPRVQVVNQIKQGHLVAIKTTPKRWGFVLHDALADYLDRINQRGC